MSRTSGEVFMFTVIEMFIETPCAPWKNQIIKGDSTDLHRTDLLSESGKQRFVWIVLVQNKKADGSCKNECHSK